MQESTGRATWLQVNIPVLINLILPHTSIKQCMLMEDSIPQLFQDQKLGNQGTDKVWKVHTKIIKCWEGWCLSLVNQCRSFQKTLTTCVTRASGSHAVWGLTVLTKLATKPDHSIVQVGTGISCYQLPSPEVVENRKELWNAILCKIFVSFNCFFWVHRFTCRL